MKIKQSQKIKRQTHSDFKSSRELCCCPPAAMVWIDSRVECCFVENQLEMKRRFTVRSDSNASLNPPGGPATNADGSGDSQIDEGTLKEQGKVYRTDIYTVHWKAEGDCRPLEVTLDVSGARTWYGSCLPLEGEVTMSKSYMMKPPEYTPQGENYLKAVLRVKSCHDSAECENMVDRP